MKEYVYYLPEVNTIAVSISPAREIFVIYIRALRDSRAFEAILLGDL